ncbi:hypothetical protein CDAR_405141 [Caerostris darwini]|uniref:Uncharacterized protein n=1 Tax=Caerostris darwini TaxID=1538125 RepID=A0AAV4U6T7_9ARAC|nr:hypothetical protein CDAR_405141 [Caerostris darwini]
MTSKSLPAPCTTKTRAVICRYQCAAERNIGPLLCRARRGDDRAPVLSIFLRGLRASRQSPPPGALIFFPVTGRTFSLLFAVVKRRRKCFPGFNIREWGKTWIRGIEIYLIGGTKPEIRRRKWKKTGNFSKRQYSLVS